MSKTKKILLVLLSLICALALAWGLASCATTHIGVTGISLSETSLTMEIGETKDITVSILPDDATDQNWTVSSDDSAVASVYTESADAFKVTAVAAGSATITVISEDDSSITATLAVTVNAAPSSDESVKVTGFTVDTDSATMSQGDTKSINVTAAPSNATDKSFTATSSNEASVTVTVNTDGTSITVTAVAAGSATITITANDGSGVSVTITITVSGSEPEPTEPTVQSVTLTPSAAQSIYVDGTVQFTATVTMSDSSSYTGTVTWTSSESTVASVSETGLVSGLTAGTTTITATAGDVTSTGVAVTVSEIPAEPTVVSVSITPATEQAIYVDGTVQFTATVTMSDGSTYDGTVSWTSTDETVASVSEDGLVTGLTAGTTYIYATADGVDSDQVLVTVSEIPAEPTVLSVSISPSDAQDILVGGTVQFSAEVTMSRGDYDGTISWTSTDETVASVSEDGLVTGFTAGTTYIYATADGVNSVQVAVTVSEPEPTVESVVIDSSNIELNVGEYTTLTATVTMSDGSTYTGEISWTSSESTVASVDEDGIVTALAAGTANITATAGGVTSEAITVTVSAVLVDSITVSDSTVTLVLDYNTSKTVTVTVNGDKITDATWTATADPTGVVSISPADGDGSGSITITAVAAGSTTVTVKSTDGNATAEISVTVKNAVTASLEDVTIYLASDNTATPELTVSNEYTDDYTVAWSIVAAYDLSGQTVLATIDSATGEITANLFGSTTVTATVTTTDGQETTATANVLVTATYFYTAGINKGNDSWPSYDTEAAAEAAGVLMTQTATNVYSITIDIDTDETPWGFVIIYGDVGDWDYQIKYYQYYDATNSNCDVTGYQDTSDFVVSETGTYTITLNLNGGVAKVSFHEGEPYVTGIEITAVPTDDQMNVGDSFTFVATVTYSNGATYTDKEVEWSSNDASISINSETGYATAVSQGSATISVSYDGHTDTVEITVIQPVTAITLNGTEAATTVDVQVDGDDATVTVAVVPSTADNATWTIDYSDYEDLISVSQDGDTLTISAVTGASAGTAYITVSSVTYPSVTATITVNVTAAAVTGIQLSYDGETSEGSVSVDVQTDGADAEVGVALLPAYADDDEWTFSYTDYTDLISVTRSGDTLTISAAEEAASGTAYITITATNASAVTATITVNVAAAALKEILVNGETETSVEVQVDTSVEETVNITFNPSYTEQTGWTYAITSGNESLVSITEGTNSLTIKAATGVESGEVTITVTSTDNDTISATITVTVLSAAITGITTSATNDAVALTLVDNAEASLTVTVTPSYADDTSWTAALYESNDGIVTFTEEGSNNGTLTITAVAAGTVVIRVSSAANENVYTDITVTVSPKLVESITLTDGDQTTYNDQTVEITVDKTLTVAVSATPETATDTSWTVESSDPEIASVEKNNDGTFTITANAVSSSPVTITVTANDGSNTVAVMYVTVLPQYITGITVTGNTNVTEYESTTLTVAVEPSNATDKTWTADVTSGSDSIQITSQDSATGSLVVEAIGIGGGTITITANDDGGYSTTVTITVGGISITDITLSASSAELVVGGDSEYATTGITVTIEPTNADDQSWSASITASDPTSGTGAVISIDPSNGTSGDTLTITAVSAGTATITVSAGDVTKTISVTVTAASFSISAEPTEATIAVGGEQEVAVAVSTEYSSNEDWDFSVDPSDESIVTVEKTADGNGLTITGVAGGTATITVYCDGDNDATATITIKVVEYSIEVGDSELNLKVGGDAAAVSVTVTAINSENDSWTFSVDPSDGSVVTVEQTETGLSITAVATGTATITVTASGDTSKTAEITVNVTNPIQSISLGDNIELNVGEETTITVTVTPSDADVATWTQAVTQTGEIIEVVSTTDNSITIKALAAGTATLEVTSTADEDVKDSITITVSAIPVTSITPEETSVTLTEGEDVTLSVSVEPEGATDATFTAESDNEDVATVTCTATSVTITAVAAGSATITLTANDGSGITATINVVVESATVYVTSIEPAQTEVTLTEGESTTVSVTVEPDNATDATFAATSSNDSVASVSGTSGSVTITAVAAGTAKITLTASDGSGVTSEISVTVNAPTATITVSSDIIYPTSTSTTLSLSVDSGTVSSVTWTSATTEVATVSGNGTSATVTAASSFKFGSTVITAEVTMASGTKIEATATVYVTASFFYQAGINQGTGGWWTTEDPDYAAEAGLILDETETGVYVWTGDIDTSETPWGFQIYFGGYTQTDYSITIGTEYYDASGSSTNYINNDGSNFKVTESGVYTITLNLNGGVATVTITEDSIDVENVALTIKSGSAALEYKDGAGTSVVYSVTVTPDDATLDAATPFTATLSSDAANYSDYVEVSTNYSDMTVNVTCLADPDEQITVTLTVTVGGVEETAVITVMTSKESTVYVTDVTFTQSQYFIRVDQGTYSPDLTATVSASVNADATVQGVTYALTTASDSSYVTVNSESGVVTASHVYSLGTFSITATSNGDDENGSPVTATCEVTVYSSAFYLIGGLTSGNNDSWGSALDQTVTSVTGTYSSWALTATDSTYKTFTGTFTVSSSDEWMQFEVSFLGMESSWTGILTGDYLGTYSGNVYYSEGQTEWNNAYFQFQNTGSVTITVDLSGSTPTVNFS
ncbi:MAG: Ig-like domain-containing protein [Clostridia bacterium]|nr:Ig-like domain-containing protein [Clostridia bacterium]